MDPSSPVKMEQAAKQSRRTREHTVRIVLEKTLKIDAVNPGHHRRARSRRQLLPRPKLTQSRMVELEHALHLTLERFALSPPDGELEQPLSLPIEAINDQPEIISPSTAVEPLEARFENRAPIPWSQLFHSCYTNVLLDSIVIGDHFSQASEIHGIVEIHRSGPEFAWYSIERLRSGEPEKSLALSLAAQ